MTLSRETAKRRLYTLAGIVVGHHFSDNPYGTWQKISLAYMAGRNNGSVMDYCSKTVHQRCPVARCRADTGCCTTGGKPEDIRKETLLEFLVDSSNVGFDEDAITVESVAEPQGFGKINQSPVQ